MKFLERFFFVIPLGLKSRFKVIMYRLFGMQLGHKNRFEGGKCRAFRQIKIGNNNAFFGGGYTIWPMDDNYTGIRIYIKDNSMFNRNLYIDACGYIEIGNGCMVGPDVYIADSNHTVKKGVSSRNTAMDVGKVIIGDNCWIGAKSIILKDVELGESCVVAAGSVVTKSFPAGSKVAGVPARLIGADS
jgi:acetyltransferase-like isoleucine patch superfamily enzyme